MADASHLEKMGRELKCPICLSLLKSAASITCNHVFCNSCIVKSMKKESNCPVCKMPFHRREIRPAPHMDNLVGIYKSMEIASGVNMLMSESVPSSQLPEKIAVACIHVHNDSQRYRDNHVRSSFPSQKRVQVAHYPLPETPVHSAKNGSKISECMPAGNQINRSTVKSNHNLSDKPGTCLSPFFWLKDDEDAEDLSQPSEGTFETDGTPPAALSFSDMKDSDKDSPCKENTQGESHGKFPAVDLSDDDMLDWTQRSCSPELWSTAAKFQIKPDQEKQPEGASHAREIHESHQSANADHLILGPGTSLTTMQQLGAAADKKPKSQNPSKGKKNARKSQTFSKKSAIKLGSPLDVDEPLNNQDPVLKSHSSILNSEENATKRRRKSTKLNTGQGSLLSAPTEISCNPTDKDINAGLPNLSEKENNFKTKSTSDRCLRSRKQKSTPSKAMKLRDVSENDNNEKNIETSTASLADSCLATNKPSKADKKGSYVKVPRVCMTKSSRRHNLKPTKTVPHNNFAGHVSKRSSHDKLQAVLGDSCMSSRQQDLNAKMPPKGIIEIEDGPAALPTMVDDHLVSREKLENCPSLTNGSNEILSPSRLKNSAVGLASNGSITLGAPSSNVLKARNVAGSSEEVVNNSTMQLKSQSLVQPTYLQNCESNPSEKNCAFCQSAEDTKPYGKMIHYIDGRPISTKHIEGSNLIHCHQICAEWAPKVYFKNDNAMNLKAEIARSRRISCSCCGVKGAALGCYHKSCHRSFHVPCAKLMPECRWDSENYVMLCPLHASSKLPCEFPGSQRKRKRASKNMSVQESLTATDIPKSDWNGDSHRSSEKIVLCCSALAAFDKDVVAQFKTLSGARESNKWSSSVTHVIASVDENEACRRTLKILMGILEGKWILSIKWIKACVEAKRLVNEKQYEITVDIHGIRDGPRLGRLRVLNKEPKLFHGLEFYLCGDFAAPYKGYLQDLIISGGGTILHRKPIVADQSKPSTFIIYNLEHDPSNNKDTLRHKRISQANALANSTGAKAASSAWILDSIAACQLQNTED